MAYLPPHQKQLNGAGAIPVPKKTKGSRDCGPRTGSVGIDFVTRGEVVPTMEQLRERMGTPGPQLTNIYDMKKGVESYESIRGRKPLRYYIKSRTADVKSAVQAGKYVQVCIDYKTFNRLVQNTGDPNYELGHSIGVLGWREANGNVQWRIYDSLDDRRRAGIPKGWRFVPREAVVKSMEAFAGGAGRCYAGVFGGGQKR